MMTFRNHRAKIKAYRNAGKMFGQTFNPGGERGEARFQPEPPRKPIYTSEQIERTRLHLQKVAQEEAKEATR